MTVKLMFAMIDRSLLLKKCFTKLYSICLFIEHDISSTKLLFLDQLKCALELFKLAVEALCRQDATLLTADGILQFLVTEAKKRSSSLA